MKTKVISFLSACLLLISAEFSAQVPCNGPYDIVNGTQCDAIMDITFYCNGTVCNTMVNVVVPFNSIFNIPAVNFCNCNGVCDIEVKLLHLGTNLNPQPVASGSLPPANFTAPTGCASSGMIHGNPSQVIIN